MLYLCRIINFTSIQAVKNFLAKLGAEKYGMAQLQDDLDYAVKFGVFENRMQKTRILRYIAGLEKDGSRNKNCAKAGEK